MRRGNEGERTKLRFPCEEVRPRRHGSVGTTMEEIFFGTDPFTYCPCSRHPPIPRKYPYHSPTDGTPCRPQFSDVGQWLLHNASHPRHRAQSEDPKAADGQYRPYHSRSLPWESPAQPSSYTPEVSYICPISLDCMCSLLGNTKWYNTVFLRKCPPMHTFSNQ